MNIDLPKGVKVFSSEETAHINFIKNKIKNIFSVWGYEEVELPVFEYYDVHKKAIGEDLKNQTFRIVDRYEGETLAIRADFTAQIARYIASLKEKQFPIRYFYEGKVFRYQTPKGDNLWEQYQAGIELVGVNNLDADAEILSISAKSLKDLGIDNFQIDLSHTGIFYGLKDLLKLDDESFSLLVEYIKGKEIYNLEKFCKTLSVPEKLKNFIIEIPVLQGDITCIQSIYDSLKEFPEITKPLEEIFEIYNIIKSYNLEDKINFDIGETREFSYYTGIIFEIFIKDYKKPVGVGGRYNYLIGKYNGDIPATGFAFNIFSLFEYMKTKQLLPDIKKDYFLINLTKNKSLSYKIAAKLREKGFITTIELISRPLKSSLEYAFKNRYKNVIVIDNLDNEVYIYTSIDNYKKIKLEEIF